MPQPFNNDQAVNVTFILVDNTFLLPINFSVVDRSEDHECQVRRIRAGACEMALSSDGPYHVCVCVCDCTSDCSQVLLPLAMSRWPLTIGQWQHASF